MQLMLALVLLASGSTAAFAACQTGITFTSTAVGTVTYLDVSSCAVDIRTGLYQDQGDQEINNYPMVAVTNPNGPGPNSYTFTLSNGAQVSAIPTAIVNNGAYVDNYTFTIVSPPTSSGSASIPLYYALGSDGSTGTYGTLNTLYTVAVNFPAVVATPTVASISPTSGPTAGGTSVAVTGTGFTGATAVSFGGTPASSFSVTSSTSITAKAPAGSGTVDVTVTTPGGTSATSSSDQFSYLSSVATLSGLSLSQGTLTPGFASGTTSYTASVANSVSSITVTPTTTDSNATVTVNGTAVTSGSASSPIALNVGSNTINVVVTAQDGTTTDTYTVSVNRAASSVATLSNLALSQGTLTPAFASGTTSYTASVANSVTSITVTPTLTDSTASVTVNGTAVASGSPSGAIALSVGSNAINVVVTAQDGSTTQTYAVSVTRAASSVSTLSNLALSQGTLNPAFASGTTSYTASVANAVTSITVTPTLTDSTASVTVNGNAVTSGSASSPIALNVGSNTITVVVTAQDGTTTDTYSVNVNRAASSVATLSSLALSQGTLTPAFASGTTSYTASVANSVTSITITPTLTDSNASVTVNGNAVASGSASGPVPLVVGSNTIRVVVTAQDGSTTDTYIVSVTRAASSVATLSNLTPSLGSLSPAFASGTTGYGIALAHGTASITLTPVLTDATASVTVNGTAVASGAASAPITLQPGNNAIPVVVTAQNGTSTTTYTVTANVALVSDAITFAPVPKVILGSAPFTVQASATSGQAVTLSSTTPGVCTLSGSTVTLLGTGTCTILGTTAGTANVAPASATLSILVNARPNPARDPNVIALVQAQNQMALDFAHMQMDNVSAHLESLHADERPHNAFGVRLGMTAGGSSPDCGRSGVMSYPLPGSMTNAPCASSGSDGYRNGHGRGGPSPDAGRSAGRPAGQTQSRGGTAPGSDIGIWAGGNINLDRSGPRDLHNNGVSAGIDYRVRHNAILGVALGYGNGRSGAGTGGGRTTGHSTNIVLYGSVKPADHTFIDMIAGRGSLRFTSQRAVTGTTDTAFGQRTGHEVFGQLSSGLQYGTTRWMMSPYARVSAITGQLDAFSETASDPAHALHYDKQVFRSSQVDVGFRGGITRTFDFGDVSPLFRAEYHHYFSHPDASVLSWADLTNGPEYVLNLPQAGQNQMTLGLGTSVKLNSGLHFEIEYRNTFGSSARQQNLMLRGSMRF